MDKELSIPYRNKFHIWLQQNLCGYKQALHWTTHDRFCGYAPIYDYYPFQFCNAFGIPVDGRLEKVNLASQLCFKAALLKDQYNDKKEKGVDEQEMNAAAKILFFKAKEILQTVFAVDSEFWHYWERRYSELKKAEVGEAMMNEKKFSYLAYRSLADMKVSIAKLAIDCNFISNGCKDSEVYEALLLSHKAFATSMQLFDDLFDLPEDLQNGQFNIAIHFLRHKCLSMGVVFDVDKPIEMEKHLFLSGVAKSILALCLKEVRKARSLVEGIDVPLWEKTLLSYEHMYLKVMEGTDEYLSLFKAKMLLSKKFKFASVEVTTILDDSFNVALEFIQRQQNTDGTWFEYHTSAGTSNIWSTAFILNMTAHLLPDKVREMAKRSLVANPGLLYGYRSRYVVDSDSSAFAILCGAGKGVKGHKSLDLLVRRQNPDGGFSTYASEDIPALRKLMHLEDDANFSGWTQSHPCVSAVILFTLLSANRKSDRIRIHMLVTFLLGHLENKRSLAYWWTSEIYTLFWLVQCCRFEVVCSLKEKVVERINLCFYEFNQPTSVGHSVEFHTPFYIAMLVRCACELRTEVNAPEFESIARSLVGRLLSLQYEDGSWDGGDALQIPEPNCIDPEFALYPVSPHGCSVRAPEYNRLFSTAVAVNALHQFRKVYA